MQFHNFSKSQHFKGNNVIKKPLRLLNISAIDKIRICDYIAKLQTEDSREIHCTSHKVSETH